MKLNRVTITGADDSCSPKDLAALSAEFPFVEWGILCSSRHAGTTRFPDTAWVDELLLLRPSLQLAAHLCGDGLVRNFIERGVVPNVASEFQRIQLNTHGYEHAPCANFIRALQELPKHQFILQYDNVNRVWNDDVLRTVPNTAALFDLSHGAGVLPDQWPEPIGKYCGYAGGLGPDNLYRQLAKLSTIVGDATIWVDMETRVRSDGDRVFDLAKVRRCLERAKPFIV